MVRVADFWAEEGAAGFADVDRIGFEYACTSELDKIATVDITIPDILDNTLRPINGGLHDAALGSSDDIKCTTCKSNFDCPGHLGIIKLQTVLYHPLLISNLKQLLNSLCPYCYDIMIPIELETKFLKQIALITKGNLEAAKALQNLPTPNKPLKISKVESNYLEKVRVIDFLQHKKTIFADKNEVSINFQYNRLPLTKNKIRSKLGYNINKLNFKQKSYYQILKSKIQFASRSLIDLNKVFESNISLPKKRKVFLPGLGETKVSTNLNLDDSIAKVIKKTNKLASKLAEEEINVTTLSSEQIELYSELRKQFFRTAATIKKCSRCGCNHPRFRTWGKARIQPGVVTTNMIEYFNSAYERQLTLAGGRFELFPEDFRSQIRKSVDKAKDILLALFPYRTYALSQQPLDKYFLDFFFVDRIIVPPNNFRRMRSAGGSSVIFSSETIWLQSILRQELQNREFKDRHQLQGILVAELQRLVNMYMDSNLSEPPYKAGGTTAKRDKGIRQRLEKKAGRFRTNLMAKRVDHAARSVISPDPALAVREVGVPIKFAKELCFPEIVNERNSAELRKLVSRGPEYPGAKRMVRPDGRELDLSKLTEEMRLVEFDKALASHELQEGPHRPLIILRQIRSGDYGILNRQPTLHKPSIMAHQIRVLPEEDTIRFHYANCAGYNADFDGDEMNLHIPQSTSSQLELRALALATNYFSNPSSGESIRGLIQDHNSVSLTLTNPNTLFSSELYIKLLYSSVHAVIRWKNLTHSINQIMSHSPRLVLEPPAILKPFKLYTGKQLLSSVLSNILLLCGHDPKKFQHTGTSKVPGHIWSGKMPKVKEPVKPKAIFAGTSYLDFMERNIPLNELYPPQKVIISNGYLVHGILDKNAIGNATGSMFASLIKVVDSDVIGMIITCLSHLYGTLLQYIGSSCSYKDLLLRAEIDIKREEQSVGALLSADEALINWLLVQCGESNKKKPQMKSSGKRIKNSINDSISDNISEEYKIQEKVFDKCNDLTDFIIPNELPTTNYNTLVTSHLVRRLYLESVMVKDRSLTTSLDGEAMRALNKAQGEVVDACVPLGTEIKFPQNSFALMVLSGAKGSKVNHSQISVMLGQQVLEGARVPISRLGKSAPEFLPYDMGAIAGGFIPDRFLTGINPSSFFFHCMAGREGLCDTAIKTASSGYLQRCIVKSMENYSTHYDLTVRNTDSSILSFIYGDDGLDSYEADRALHGMIGDMESTPTSDFVEIIKKRRGFYKLILCYYRLQVLTRRKWYSDEIKEVYAICHRAIILSQKLNYIRLTNIFTKWAEYSSYYLEKENNLSFAEYDSSFNTNFEYSSTIKKDLLDNTKRVKPTSPWYKELLQPSSDSDTDYYEENTTYKKYSIKNINYNKSVKFSFAEDSLVYKELPYIKRPNELLPLSSELAPTIPCVHSEKHALPLLENVKLCDKFLNSNSALTEKTIQILFTLFNLGMASVSAGEFVGILASQSLGEPSTQMTLNTFHLAGSGAGNVTLGVPRLRELIMTRPSNPSTPQIVCIYSGSIPEMESLAKTLLPIQMTSLLRGVAVRQSVSIVNGRMARNYDLAFQLASADELENLGLSQSILRDIIKYKLLPVFINSLKAAIGVHSSVTSVEDKPSTLSKIEKARATRASKEKDRDDDGDSDSEADEELEELGQDELWDGEIPESDIEIECENGDNDSESEPLKLTIHDHDIKEDFSTLENSFPKEKTSYENVPIPQTLQIPEIFTSGSRCFFLGLRIPSDECDRSLAIASVARTAAEKVQVRSVAGVKNIHIEKNNTGDTRVTFSGVNIRHFFSSEELLPLLEHLNLETCIANDVVGILEVFGVEAALTSVRREINSVCSAYGININSRHIGLIAERLLHYGRYVPCNRNGLEMDSSVCLQMTFETSTKCLLQACNFGRSEDMKAPAAALITGSHVQSGTHGPFSILQNLNSFATV